MLLCTSILAVYYLSVQLPYLLSISSILKDYWGTNPKFCFILHFYCLSTIFHSTCLCHLSFILTLPPCSLLPLFARSWINTRLALLALPCSRSFAEVSPRLTQNIKSTPKISSMTGLFYSLLFNVESNNPALLLQRGYKTISRGFTRMATQISNTAVDENNKQWCFNNDFLMQPPTLECLKGAFILSRLLWCYFSAIVIFINIFNKILFYCFYFLYLFKF